MKILHDIPVWAPTDAELRVIDQRVRSERAKAFRGAVTYVARKVGNAFVGERGADEIHMMDTRAS